MFGFHGFSKNAFKTHTGVTLEGLSISFHSKLRWEMAFRSAYIFTSEQASNSFGKQRTSHFTFPDTGVSENSASSILEGDNSDSSLPAL